MSILVPIDSGGIILSYKCNCRCRHCLYCGSPDWQEWMEISDLRLIFEGLLKTSRKLQGFHLGGGEPFLDFDKLLRVQRLATEFGIPIEYVETNVGWCTSEEIANERFTQLKDAGLRCVLISSSPFHAEYIPLSRIITAVKVGYEVFGPNGVILWIPEFYRQLSEIRTDGLISLDEYIEHVGKGVARVMLRSEYSLITGGRIGYELADLYERGPAECCQNDQCKPELLESGHVHFDPYGNLIPSFCAGISLGDARDLESLMNNLDLNRLPIVQVLAESGPYALYEFAVRELGYQPLKKGYVGKCHLCVDVRRWIKSVTDEFAELATAEYYDQLGKRTNT